MASATRLGWPVGQPGSASTGALLRADCGMPPGRAGRRRARALYRTAESRRMSDSTEPVPVRTSFTADEIDTIYNDLWAAGYVLHCTDIEDGEVVVPTVDRLREIGDGLLEPTRPTRVRAGEPLGRATLSQSLYPELSIRSFSKLDQTDHIRLGRSRIRMRRAKLGVQESDEKNAENHNLRFNGIFRLLCVNIFPAGSAHADLVRIPALGPAAALCSRKVASATTRPRSTARICIARQVVSASTAFSGR